MKPITKERRLEIQRFIEERIVENLSRQVFKETESHPITMNIADYNFPTPVFDDFDKKPTHRNGFRQPKTSKHHKHQTKHGLK